MPIIAIIGTKQEMAEATFHVKKAPIVYWNRTPNDKATDDNAVNIPRKCGWETSEVYTLAGAPTIPLPIPSEIFYWNFCDNFY